MGYSDYPSPQRCMKSNAFCGCADLCLDCPSDARFLILNSLINASYHLEYSESSQYAVIMSLCISVGDIVVCLQLVHRVFSIIGKGRKNAPRDLKELQNALFGLSCTLELLKKEHEKVMSSQAAPDTTIQTSQFLGYLILSCEETLYQLEDAAEQYKEALNESGNVSYKDQLKIQWKRILWSMRGDTLMQYRDKLRSHTDSINLLLNTSVWSVHLQID